MLVIFASGRGVIFPSKRDSITRGTAGCGDALGVAVTAGVSVRTKLVGKLVLTGLVVGAGVSVAATVGCAVGRTGKLIVGILRLGNSRSTKPNTPITIKTPRAAKDWRARMALR